MKLKVVAIGLIAANFTFVSLAHAQQAGYGLYGGTAPCGYNNGPAPGAVSIDDGYADLLQQREDYKKERTKLKGELGDQEGSKLLGQQNHLQDKISGFFRPKWAEVIEKHISGRMNCGICDDDSNPTAPPVPAPLQPPPPPLPNIPPTVNLQPSPSSSTSVTTPGNHVPNDPGSPDVGADGRRPDPLAMTQAQLDACGKKHPAWKNRAKFTKADQVRNCSSVICRQKPENQGKSSDELDRICKPQDGALNDVDRSSWLPAYFAPESRSSRMPASDPSEQGASRGSRQPPPVPAGSSVQEDGMSDIDVPTSFQSSGHSAVTCYPKQAPYWNYATRAPYKAWTAICHDGGIIDPVACQLSGKNALTTGQIDYNDCSSTLQRYFEISKRVDAKQARLREVEREINRLDDQISDYKSDEDNLSDSDKAILEASAARKAGRSGGGGRNGPSFGQALLSVGLGLAGGVGTTALLNSGDRSEWRNNNAALTSLGWQTLPYQQNPANIAAGMGVFQGITGGLMGSFGCGQTTGGINGGIFGNPYAQNPYASMGGGMFNGAGPWGVSGPWGNQGLLQGGGLVGGFSGGYPIAGGGYGGGGYPISGGGYGGGGYPIAGVSGIAGGFSGGYPISGGGYPISGGGYPISGGGFNGMPIQGYNYSGGGFPISGGGYPIAGVSAIGGGFSGGYPISGGGYGGGAIGYGGFPIGGSGGYAGYGGYGGTIVGSYGGGYQGGSITGNAYQYQMEQANRYYANQIGTQQQYSGLNNQLAQVMQQMQLLQYGGLSNSSSYGLGVSPYSFSPSLYNTGSILSGTGVTTIPATNVTTPGR